MVTALVNAASFCLEVEVVPKPLCATVFNPLVTLLVERLLVPLNGEGHIVVLTLLHLIPCFSFFSALAICSKLLLSH